MGENVVFCVFAYQKFFFLFLNDSDKNGVRGLPDLMPHAYLNILVKVSSEMLQNCGNAYVKFNSASYFLSYTTSLYIEISFPCVLFKTNKTV